MSRILARENLMQLVFEYNFVKDNTDELYLEDKLTDEDKEYVLTNLSEIKNHYDEIVGIISNNLVNYKLERVCKTDLAILVVAIYEIKYLNSPCKVVVNEAVELAKKYSNKNSFKFVNGLLAKVIESAV